MTASAFWIGVELMPRSVLSAAIEHERPIFCGQLPADSALQAQLGEMSGRAEWHDVALGTSIGQGYLLDLLRQRLPVDSLVLALDISGNKHREAFQTAPVDEQLAKARDVIEALLIVIRGADAVMQPGPSAKMTIMLTDTGEIATPLTEGLAAFVAQFAQAEAARWAEKGRSLHIQHADSGDE